MTQSRGGRRAMWFVLVLVTSCARATAGPVDPETEADRLIRPTMIALDFRDRPMSEVIREVSKTGCPLRIYELQTDWLAQRITLREPAPVPFWKAVDRICEVGRFQYNLGSGPDGVSVSLFRDEVSGPASDHGVFRAQIEEISYNGRYRKLHLGRDRTSRPIVNDDDKSNSCIQLRIMAEPRMMIREDGPLKDLVVDDDLGQSLLPAEPAAEQERFAFGYSTIYVLEQVPLKRIERPGKAIRTLSGKAPVSVAARRREPLVVPLAGAAGRSFRGGDSIVTVRVAKAKADDGEVAIVVVKPGEDEEKAMVARQSGLAVELSIRAAEQAASRPIDPGDLAEEQFEVVGDDGKVWTTSPWLLGGGGARRAEGGEVRIVVRFVDDDMSPCPANLAGAKLRYYEMIHKKVDVPFTFADIPLP